MALEYRDLLNHGIIFRAKSVCSNGCNVALLQLSPLVDTLTATIPEDDQWEERIVPVKLGFCPACGCVVAMSWYAPGD